MQDRDRGPPGDLVQQLSLALSRPPAEHPSHLTSPLLALLHASTNHDQLATALPILASVINSDRAPPFTTLWAASALHLVLSNPSLPPQLKTNLALQSVGAVARLLASASLDLQKTGLQSFATTYPLLFKTAATTSNDDLLWNDLVKLKTASVTLWRTGANGPKVASVKVLQRIIQTQTKGTADPRLQRTSEPNLSLVRANHPYLHLSALEDEAHKLLEEFVTTLFTSPSADVVAAVTVSLGGLVKIRPALAQLIVTALVNWTPAALDGGAVQVRSAEKTVRVVLSHLLKTTHASAFASQITDFLARQASRMDSALALAIQKREQQDASRKRPAGLSDDPVPDVKRRRVDPDAERDTFRAFEEAARRTGAGLAGFDAKTLALAVVVELVVANLQSVAGDVLEGKIADVRRSLTAVSAEAFAPEAPDEPVDPLSMDDDEFELKAEVPAPEPQEEDDEDGGALLAPHAFDLATESDLAPMLDIPAHARTTMIEAALKRICSAGSDGAPPSIWVPLVSRLVTRGLRSDGAEDSEGEDRRERLRAIMYDFVVEDLRARMEFARVWLNEEWYVDGFQTTEGRPYERWLRKLLQYIGSFATNRDKSFAQFMIDLPAIPRDAVVRLGDMCTNLSQVQLGFAALRDLALLRPPSRQAAVDVLLSLTSHPDKMTRNAAINTVKRWVPDVTVLSARIGAFSKLLFSRLEVAPAAPKKEEDEDDEMDMDDGATPPPPALLARVEGGIIVEGLPPPTTLPEILQHVELIFALSVKSPDLLGHVFESYGRLQPFAQESIPPLITPVIRSLGVQNPTLLELIRLCPPGSDDLVLKVVQILQDKGRLPAHLATVVREMAHEKEEINPRIYMLVIAECDKADIIKYVPRICKLLNNSHEYKAAIRSIFLSIIIAPSQQFGSSSNAPRTRQSELLTPVELMTLLHTSEKEIGLKPTIEAISICFSMSDAFRAEMLVSFMQAVVDEPVIPVLFLRTVLQAVTTYKSVQAFVSSTLLARLIAREVWTTPPLWEGFIRVAKTTAPNSFNALLLLPKEQLIDVLAKQPALKASLREFALKKTGAHRAKIEPQLEVLGEAEEGETAEGGERWDEAAAPPADVVMSDVEGAPAPVEIRS